MLFVISFVSSGQLIVSSSALDAAKIKRVVVRGVNWVGDAVMTIPALRELRRVLPAAHITLATRSWAEGLFADADFIDDLLIYDRQPFYPASVLRQVSAWRRQHFDLAILFQNAFEAALIALMARVSVRLGYATDGRSVLLTHPLALPAWRAERHEIFYYLNIIAGLEKHLGCTPSALERTPQFDLQVSDARQEKARALLQTYGLSLTDSLVALCPGSINSRAKRWPAERYAALADRFIEETGASVALIGSRDELEVSEEVARLMRHQPLMLTGVTDLAEVVAVLSLTDILITNDTGPAHIAAALNRPTLVIFGPTNPATTRPFAETAELVRHPPDCAPCMLRDCPIDHRCMTAISPDEVFKRALAMMNKQQIPVELELKS